MLSDARKQGLAELQSALKYQFRRLPLLVKALTHKSYVNENSEELKHNERFEFLGDSVLDLIVSDYMINKYDDYSEGALSKIRASVVNETCLANLARKINLGDYLYLGKGEELSGGKNKSSLLANGFEALVGAMYLDGNLEKVSDALLPLLREEIEKVADNCVFHDFKSDLQEYTQNKFVCIPSYKVVKESGPDHEKIFEVSVTVKSQIHGTGSGKSKKEAEQAAAKKAMENFTP